MYRPNRIGPNPLITLETVPAGRTELFTAVYGSTIDAEIIGGVPFDNVSARSVFFSEDISIPAGEQGSIGVSILGTPLNVNDIDRQYILSAAGSVLGFSSDEAVGVIPVVGRVSENGVALTSLNFWSLPPSNNSEHVRTSGGEVSSIGSSFNSSMVMGDFFPQGGDPETNDLYAGWWFTNGGASPVTIANVHLSVSIHRYTTDLNPFDPNR